MNTKNFKRLLAIVMTLVCVFVCVVFEPASALAAGARSDRILSGNIETVNGMWESDPNVYVPLVGELTSEREEAVKRFRRADGATELVSYDFPVHYNDNGKWAAIDNTLKYDEKTGRFVNTANDFIVELGADEPVLNISYNGETLSIAGIDLPGITDKELSAAVEEREKKEDLTDEEKDDLLRFPEELSSAIAYYTVDGKEAGLEYKLSGKSISEYITVSEKPETVPTYVYSFTTTLTPRMEENAVFFEDRNGETVMYFSAPVMADADGNESFDFAVDLVTNEDGSYTYSLAPDEDFLMNEETVYPVVIDPDINMNFRSNVQDTYITSAYPNQIYGLPTSPAPGALKVGDSNDYHTLIRLEDLNELSVGDVIVSAAVILTRISTSSNAGKEIDAYRMNDIWYENTLTWNIFSGLNGGQPYDTSRIESLALSNGYQGQSAFDITDLYKKWLAGEEDNYGIVLKSNYYTMFCSSRYSSSLPFHPYFSIVYINSTGLESRFSYSSHSAGRAGTGSVNLFSGNLTFAFDDAGISNGTMPISVSHVYNANDKDEDIGYGHGWRLNYSQSIEAVSIQNRTETATYYEFIDGDGTRHYYKKKTGAANTYVNELDKDSELTIDTSANEITITDKGDNKLVFACALFDHDENSATPQAYRGRLIRIEDANGNKTLIEYSNTTDVTDLRISAVREKLASASACGQSVTMTYTDEHLHMMFPPNGLNRLYYYSSGNDLTIVNNTDSTASYYSYNAHKLTKARNIDKYSLNYTYDTLGRVTRVQEKADTTAGNYIDYDYGWNVTTVTDNRGRDIVYQFNDAGQAVSVRDNEGSAVYAAYNTAEQTTTQLSAVSKLQHTVVNLLKNPSFDNDAPYLWAVTGTGTTIYAGVPHTGRYSLKLNAGGYASQSVTVTPGETYTLSAYFTGAPGGKVEVYSGSALLAASDPTELTSVPGESWERAVKTFTVPSGITSVTVRVSKSSSSIGNTFADSAQLEAGASPNRVNLIVNSDLSDGLNSFTSTGFDSNDGVVTNSDTTHPSGLSSNVLKITGSFKNEYVMQKLLVTGKKGDTYSFGGWCASDSIPMGYQYGNVLCGEKSIKVSFYNGNTLVNSATAYFGADTADWQFASSSAVAAGVYTEIRVYVRFCYSRNTAYFDGIQLYREEFSQGYEYDSNGNLKKYTSLISQENDFQYDSSNNLTSAKDARGNTTTYTYDSDHNLLTSTTPEGVVTTNTYDTNGNVTQTQVGNNTDYIKAATTYDSASALASAVTDARGNSVTYTYNSTTRQQTTVTDPKNNTSTYAYGSASAMLRLASLTSPTGTGSSTATVSYGYDTYGKLTDITRAGTVYSFTYDQWGRVVDTKVGNMTLSTNVYDQYGRLDSVVYGNGFVTEYVYDALDRVDEINQGTANNTVLTYKFIYNGEGDLYELRNYKTLRSTFFEYDHAGRCMASTEKSFTVSGGAVTYTGTVSGYRYEYDANNNLTKLTCIVNGASWETTYTYDKDNRPISALLDNGRSIVNTYDAIGRITSRALMNGSSTVKNTSITYVPGADGSKTALVATYQNGTDAAYSYTYDANGNITEITQGTASFTYQYDAANQLVREDLFYGTGDTNNATYTYTYDDWGNILNKKKYAYTTGTLGSVLNTKTYGYTNSQWGDLLTSYNGSTITYDAMGNMASYGSKSYSWEGKQLVEINLLNTMYYTFSYDENGLRTSKTTTWISGGTEETTEYFYNGSVLIGMKTGSTVMRFSYDAGGNVVSVDYSEDNGANFTTYYYLRNAQSDIVKLIDGSGNTVVEYTYDSWGKALSVTGSLSDTLGEDQPFRYRGYVYDEETDLYYLQSRYYDPKIGRFISADIYLSTGQGVIGNNSLTYCNNNPVVLNDSQGTYPVAVEMTDCNPGKTEYDYACECFGGEAYYSIDSAVLAWCKKNIPLTQKDHRERGGVIVSVTINDKKFYSVTTTITGVNGTCWNAFVFGSLNHLVFRYYDVEGFVHTHTAYPPNETRPDWYYSDGGPSDPDLFLFKFPWIKRQFIGNELGGVYEFYMNNTYRMIWGDKDSEPEMWP